MKNFVMGLLIGLCITFLLGANSFRYVDGHSQSSLSSVSETGEVYLAITNTASGNTVVHKFDRDDFVRSDQLTFDAASVIRDRVVINAK